MPNKYKNFNPHTSQSWYLSVLVKNYGSLKKAKEAIKQSRIRADMTMLSASKKSAGMRRAWERKKSC